MVLKNKLLKQKESNHWAIWIAILILTVFIIYENLPPTEQESEIEEVNPLIEILEFEIASATEYFKIMKITPSCLDYATYYNTSLQKYPGLDIRWPRRMDICNNRTYCEGLHTYLLVNGYCAEFILDGDRYVGIFICDWKK